MTVLCNAQSDSTKMELKYNYISAPKYSLDEKEYLRTRNEFSFRAFYPEFRAEYAKHYGSGSLDHAESQHLWATLMGIPGGLLLGLGISEFLFHRNEKDGIKTGTIFSIASIPLLGLSIKLDLDSFRTIKNGMNKPK